MQNVLFAWGIWRIVKGYDVRSIFVDTSEVVSDEGDLESGFFRVIFPNTDQACCDA